MTSAEVPIWHKSSHSGTDNACVEHATLPTGHHAIRDTKDPARRATLTFHPAAWQHFLDRLSRS
ncbi:DUF397 domain-containing protein [Streptomyces orinoci]|uniref:DUF397 domain-containing protein n=1 Tax=Streptomyces orinoci TaxID=67339 RepID=A0ABV3JUX4_STRON|nr:DUF397 domain-containing protein [Streptomyces orinoci]